MIEPEDLKRGKEPPWREWYRSPIWKAIKRHRLTEAPHCQECAKVGREVAATRVAHVEPHRGDKCLFMKYENTQSLCDRHYKSHGRRQRRG